MIKNNISRRNFIKDTSKVALGASIFSSFLSYKAIANSFLANVNADDDYKVLVCFFKGGGNDSFNMLIPRGNAYQAYRTTRSNLAIDEDELLPIYPTNTNGKQFGLHPSMPEVQSLFNENKLSFISNIGTLIQPTTAEQAQNESVPLPLGLFSHADQTQEWMTGKPHERVIKGWGGIVADKISSMNPQNSISMNVSLAGTNIFQNGNDTIEFSIGINEDDVGIMGYNDESWDGFNQGLTNGIDSLFDHKYNDVFKQTYSNTIKKSIEGLEIYNNAIQSTDDLTTEFTDNSVSGAFKAVAKMIKANNFLGFKRQIYYIQYDGWDHHDELLDSQSLMLREVSKGFGEFNQAMEEINMQKNVTVFTMSEFGRTLTSNGNGTDHAWGGNVMVMGGDVVGKKIFGDYPTLNLDNELMLWDGVIVPTLSTDEYFAELTQWFGLDKSHLPSLFPNLKNFHDINSGTKPIGFMEY